MALKVWLPLNGTFINNGFLDKGITSENGIFASFGKVTPLALTQGSVTINYKYAPKIFNNVEFSWAGWVKILETLENIPIFNTNSNPKRFAISQYPYNSLTFTTSFDDSSTEFEYSISDFFPTNEWVHVAITYKKGELTIYKNGELQEQFNKYFEVSDWNEQDILMIENSSSRMLNDIRLYNHCLSVKEVKELSKGLCLHYTMSRPGANLLKNSNFANGTNSWVADSSTMSVLNDTNFKNILSFNATTENIGRVYNSNSGMFISGTTYSYSFYAKASSSVNITPSREHEDDGTTVTLTTIWTKYEGTIVATNNSDNFSFYSNNTTSTIYLANVKLEEGSKTTSWIPNNTDTLYNLLGFNSNEETDKSGYENNGVANNFTYWNSNTPRYLTSRTFNGVNSYILCHDPINSQTTEFTISTWINIYTINSIKCLWSGRSIDEGPVTLYINMDTINFFDSYSTYVDLNLIPNNWYYIVVTWKNNGYKNIYVNGVLQVTEQSGTINEKENTYASIGCKSTDSQSPNDYAFDGCISDFRIYTTVLSEDDIKELYNVGLSIDNGSNVHSYELVEN